jgi:CrcB protein
MTAALAVALGGAIGTAIRYGAALLAARWLGPELPYGTLAVNLCGAYAIGLAQELAAITFAIPEPVRLFIVTGILGGMTTYSAFTYEAVRMMAFGEWGKACFYVLATNLLCFALCWLGIATARALTGAAS